jgi:hypothetical protein
VVAAFASVLVADAAAVPTTAIVLGADFEPPGFGGGVWPVSSATAAANTSVPAGS